MANNFTQPHMKTLAHWLIITVLGMTTCAAERYYLPNKEDALFEVTQVSSEKEWLLPNGQETTVTFTAFSIYRPKDDLRDLVTLARVEGKRVEGKIRSYTVTKGNQRITLVSSGDPTLIAHIEFYLSRWEIESIIVVPKQGKLRLAKAEVIEELREDLKFAKDLMKNGPLSMRKPKPQKQPNSPPKGEVVPQNGARK